MYGDYPETMKKNVGSRLPSFNSMESRLVKGSADFLAINFYVAAKVKDSPRSLWIHPRDYAADVAVELDCMPQQVVPFLFLQTYILHIFCIHGSFAEECDRIWGEASAQMKMNYSLSDLLQ